MCVTVSFFLAVLSGKELFSYNAALFVDDESAFDTTSDRAINEEIKTLARLEEERIREETAKAQAEQLRLFELQQIEFEARRAREQMKRDRALAPDRKTFLFCGVVVNQAVFEEEEEEDLEYFTDLPLPTPKSSSGAGEDSVESGLKHLRITGESSNQIEKLEKNMGDREAERDDAKYTGEVEEDDEEENDDDEEEENDDENNPDIG